MSARRILTTFLYLGFVGSVSWACFRRPVPDDFDRYIYEALVRGNYQTVEEVYPIVKHSYRRAEESSVLDSPTHLGQLEPLYAIKPLYLRAIEATSFTRLSFQARINLISALSLFGMGVVLLGWTGQRGYSALLLTASPIVVLGRMGTPDGLSTMVVLGGIWALSRSQLLIGAILLLVSIWIRTDNFLLVLAVVAYLLWRGRITWIDSAVLAALAAGSVEFINHFSGNYGWRVLFQYSFIGGSPADVVPHFGVAQYLGIAAHSARTIMPQVTVWALLAIVSWRWSAPEREWLIPVWIAVVGHFMLYPSPESRYLVWAFIVTGAIFIGGIRRTTGSGIQRATSGVGRGDGPVSAQAG